MVSVLGTPSVVDRGFTPRSGRTKHYEIRMCCFSAKHTLLRRNNKDWFQGANTIQIQLTSCWANTKRITLSSHGMYLAHLAFNKSFTRSLLDF